MGARRSYIGVSLAITVLLALAGCGGGGGNTASPTGAWGSATFTLAWAAGRSVLPDTVQSVRLEVSTGGTRLATLIRERPENGGILDVQVDHLPTGTLQYRVLAFADAQGTGLTLGSITGIFEVQADEDTPVSVNLEVSKEVAAVTLTAPETRVAVGKTLQLSASAKTIAGTVVLADFSWVSTVPRVALVDEHGLVTAREEGTTIITAREVLSGKSANVTITVYLDADALVLSVTPASASMAVGETVQLIAALKYADGTPLSGVGFVWASSDARVASVNGRGLVTGASAGAATITVTDDYLGRTRDVAITVEGTPGPVGTGKIVFQSDRSGALQIYRVNADGSGLRQLTTGIGPNESPVFNATGTRIAYVNGAVGSRSIYLMDADGANNHRLSTVSGDVNDPAFSPDGEKILYAGSGSGHWNLYLHDLSTGVNTRLTSGEADDEHPSYSRDGRTIVFQSNRDGDRNIYRMDVGGAMRQLTSDPAWDGMPVFNHAGTQIAFMTNRGNGVAYQTYLMSPDGSGQRRVLNTSYCSRMPAFSPDDSQVTYASNPTNQFDIYVSNLDGAGLTLVTSSTGRDWHPCWAP